MSEWPLYVCLTLHIIFEPMLLFDPDNFLDYHKEHMLLIVLDLQYANYVIDHDCFK